MSTILTSIDEGDTKTVTLSVNYEDDLVDPATLVLEVRPPTGALRPYTYGDDDGVIVRTGAGLYRATLDELDEVGYWRGAWKTTGPQGTETFAFWVEAVLQPL